MLFKLFWGEPVVNSDKVRDDVLKTIKASGVEPKYVFLVFKDQNNLTYVSSTQNVEVHTVLGMIERAKYNLLTEVGKK